MINNAGNVGAPSANPTAKGVATTAAAAAAAAAAALRQSRRRHALNRHRSWRLIPITTILRSTMTRVSSTF